VADEKPEPYRGNVCPGCDRIAAPFKGGHDAECRWWAPTPGRKQ
jgi:hypothetical protein